MLVDDSAETQQTGQARPRIPPAHVDLDGESLKKLRIKLRECQLQDRYEYAHDNNAGCFF
jgi:hypothetical protein